MNQPFQKEINDGKSCVKQASGEEMERWQGGKEGGREEEEGTLLPGGTWVWEGSGNGRWPHTRGAAWLRSTAAIPRYV